MKRILKETVGNGGFSAALRVDSESNPVDGSKKLLNLAGEYGIMLSKDNDIELYASTNGE